MSFLSILLWALGGGPLQRAVPVSAGVHLGLANRTLGGDGEQEKRGFGVLMPHLLPTPPTP